MVGGVEGCAGEGDEDGSGLKGGGWDGMGWDRGKEGGRTVCGEGGILIVVVVLVVSVSVEIEGGGEEMTMMLGSAGGGGGGPIGFPLSQLT